MSIPNLLAPEREIEFIRHVLIFPIGHCSGPAFRPTPSNQGVTFFKRSDFFFFFFPFIITVIAQSLGLLSCAPSLNATGYWLKMIFFFFYN